MILTYLGNAISVCSRGFHVFQKLINDYPLVMTNIAIENHQFQWVKSTINGPFFNSYVKLPEGNCTGQSMIKSSVFFVQLHAAQVVSATETELTFQLLGMHFVSRSCWVPERLVFRKRI